MSHSVEVSAPDDLLRAPRPWWLHLCKIDSRHPWVNSFTRLRYSARRRQHLNRFTRWRGGVSA